GEEGGGGKGEGVAMGFRGGDEGGVKGGVPAVVASATRRVDSGVLWKRTQGLSYRRPAAPERLESWKWGRQSSGRGGRRVDLRVEQIGSQSVQVSRIDLIVVEQISLQVRADDGVVRGFEHRAGRKLPLDGQVEVVVLRRPCGFVPLPPGHAVAVREGGIDERRRLPRWKALTHDKRRLNSVAAVAGL